MTEENQSQSEEVLDPDLDELGLREDTIASEPQPVAPPQAVAETPQPAKEVSQLSSEVILGISSQLERASSILDSHPDSGLKVKRAKMKLSEALNWLKQELRSRKSDQ